MIPGRMFGPYITRDIYSSYKSFHCYESTFEIEAVKPEDIGTMYVFVSNDRGHAGAQISIQLARLQAGAEPAPASGRFLVPATAASGATGARPSWPALLAALLVQLAAARLARPGRQTNG